VDEPGDGTDDVFAVVEQDQCGLGLPQVGNELLFG
jgi:hypothetical protein